jgi:hypothetical protein
LNSVVGTERTMLACYAERRTELFDYVPVLEGALAPDIKRKRD